MNLGPCAICTRIVDSTHSYAYRVVGWESVRRGGGANQIIDRQRLGAIAHVQCVRTAMLQSRSGIHPQQQVLE